MVKIVLVPDENEELVCTNPGCGRIYTMREFRCFCWKLYSEICWQCERVRITQLLRDLHGIDLDMEDEVDAR